MRDFLERGLGTPTQTHLKSGWMNKQDAEFQAAVECLEPGLSFLRHVVEALGGRVEARIIAPEFDVVTGAQAESCTTVEAKTDRVATF
jgi:hypothetical protein